MLAGPVGGAVGALLLGAPGGVPILVLARAEQGPSTAAAVPATVGDVSAATAGDEAGSRGRPRTRRLVAGWPPGLPDDAMVGRASRSVRSALLRC